MLKGLTEFYRHRSTSDGVGSSCKDCTKARVKQRYAERRDEISIRASARYYNNRDAVRARTAEYQRKNPEKAAVWKAKYRSRNRSRYSAYGRERASRIRSLPAERVSISDVSARDGAWCWMCGCELSEFSPAHLDHLVPVSAGADLLASFGLTNPGTVLANMALACPPCNIRKSNKILMCAVVRYLRNAEGANDHISEAC